MSALLLGVSLSLVGCDDGEDGEPGPPGPAGEPGGGPDNFSFEGIPVPRTPEAKASVQASPEVTIDETTHAIGHHVLVASGDKVPMLGASGDVTWGAWTKADGSNYVLPDGSLRVSNQDSGPDFTSLLTYEDDIFSITNLESSNGGAYISKLEQDPATGELSLLASRPVDASGVHGLYVNCAGMVTAWGTHLGSEEYEPPMAILDEAAQPHSDDDTPPWADQPNMAWFDDPSWHDEHMLAIAMYNSLDNAIAERSGSEQAVGAKTFGYYFGWIPEIAVNGSDGEHTVTKHYAMGRFAHELAYVMPDERTVYLSDDGSNTGLFMFVADEPQDLSSGTLYAAQWNQTSASGLGTADIRWVNLGHASSDEIAPALVETSPMDEGIRFEDMFEQAEPNADGSCPAGFENVNAYDHGLICVSMKHGRFDVDGNGADPRDPTIETLASRLETRIYAELQGATTEFRKEEGISFDPFSGRLYVAMSEVARGMMNGYSFEKESDRYDLGGHNHIRLNRPNLCGGVYGMDTVDATVSEPEAQTQDTDGGAIDSEYLAVNMYGVIEGRDNGDPTQDDTCALASIANPDNIAFLPEYGELLIGEDGNHDNNVVWSYDVQRDLLTRFVTVPEGAETTSPYWHTNVNGWGYVTVVAQHPGGGADTSIGYIGPMPPLD